MEVVLLLPAVSLMQADAMLTAGASLKLKEMCGLHLEIFSI